MDLTQETILTFLLENGGRVKNSELLNKFNGLINCSDTAEKKCNRDLFKRFVNNVAVVKQIDNIKFVVVRKKYNDFIKAERAEFVDVINLNSSLTPCSVERSCTKCESFTTLYYSDAENNNSCVCSNRNHSCSNGSLGNKLSGFPTSNNRSKESHNAHDETVMACHDDSLRATVVSVSGEAKTGKSAAVFAVVAVKSPSNSPIVSDKMDNSNLKVLPQQHALSVPSGLHKGMAELTEPIPVTENQVEVVVQKVLSRSPHTKKRLFIPIPSSPLLRKGSKVTKVGCEPKYSEVVPLEATEHEWLMKAATGHWSHVHGLLLQDAQLAKKRNFISGFTALHWAAKCGNIDMVGKIIDISRQNGGGIDVNVKSHDGYTPLHIAAIHNHEPVMTSLVRDYAANTYARDNSGKKPCYYLRQDAAREVRALLEPPRVVHRDGPCERTEDDHYLSELPRGFNTLSRLFQPQMGHRKKHRHRSSLHFIGYENECDKNKHPNQRLFH